MGVHERGRYRSPMYKTKPRYHEHSKQCKCALCSVWTGTSKVVEEAEKLALEHFEQQPAPPLHESAKSQPQQRKAARRKKRRR